ncbi:unnamed protein product [Spirodela intermedia]|uniref:Uncharacterized protein n=1 Tax=Spirodela intermedia TaxID=51605 RepID=A0A7I8LKB8_SPIIN|nr:unnamed protein product [Spirodela intermedia]
MESLLERFKLYLDHQSLMKKDDAGVVLQRISAFCSRDKIENFYCYCDHVLAYLFIHITQTPLRVGDSPSRIGDPKTKEVLIA